MFSRQLSPVSLLYVMTRINEPLVDAHVFFMDKLFYFLSEVGKLGVRVT